VWLKTLLWQNHQRFSIKPKTGTAFPTTRVCSYCADNGARSTQNAMATAKRFITVNLHTRGAPLLMHRYESQYGSYGTMNIESATIDLLTEVIEMSV